MTAEELREVMLEWQVNAAELAKLLCLHSNRLSEYLGGVERIPCSIAYSVQALRLLPPRQREELFQERLSRPTHGR